MNHLSALLTIRCPASLNSLFQNLFIFSPHKQCKLKCTSKWIAMHTKSYVGMRKEIKTAMTSFLLQFHVYTHSAQCTTCIHALRICASRASECDFVCLRVCVCDSCWRSFNVNIFTQNYFFLHDKLMESFFVWLHSSFDIVGLGVGSDLTLTTYQHGNLQSTYRTFMVF